MHHGNRTLHVCNTVNAYHCSVPFRWSCIGRYGSRVCLLMTSAYQARLPQEVRILLDAFRKRADCTCLSFVASLPSHKPQLSQHCYGAVELFVTSWQCSSELRAQCFAYIFLIGRLISSPRLYLLISISISLQLDPQRTDLNFLRHTSCYQVITLHPNHSPSVFIEPIIPRHNQYIVLNCHHASPIFRRHNDISKSPYQSDLD